MRLDNYSSSIPAKDWRFHFWKGVKQRAAGQPAEGGNLTYNRGNPVTICTLNTECRDPALSSIDLHHPGRKSEDSSLRTLTSSTRKTWRHWPGGPIRKGPSRWHSSKAQSPQALLGELRVQLILLDSHTYEQTVKDRSKSGFLVHPSGQGTGGSRVPAVCVWPEGPGSSTPQTLTSCFSALCSLPLLLLFPALLISAFKRAWWVSTLFTTQDSFLG